MALTPSGNSPETTLALGEPSQVAKPGLRTINPLGVYQLRGLAPMDRQHLPLFTDLSLENLGLENLGLENHTLPGELKLLGLDPIRGHLLLIDSLSDACQILNPYHAFEFLDGRGLCLQGGELWFCRDQEVYTCELPNLQPQVFAILTYPVTGVAVDETTVYVACQKSGYIHLFDRKTAKQIHKYASPGIGEQNLTLWQEHLWVCDRLEQSVYCLDRKTGSLQFTLITPLEAPTALVFSPGEHQPLLYVAYSIEETYLRDNPNSIEQPLEIAVRDRASIRPLYYAHVPERYYALSNGYRLEMSYMEELSPLEEVRLENLEWRMALPAQTDRQTVSDIQPLGMPFTEQLEEGQRVAVFNFDRLQPGEARLFGWKAQLQVRGIKYLLTPADTEDCPPLSLEFQAKYLIDDDRLAMDNPMVQAAAREAIGSETNILRKILKIRNYVYDRLSYGLVPRIDTPDVVLARGVGSCGEYVGVLLALARLNGIACRTVGRYKCPPYPDHWQIPLQPDYNHVWLEFYIPGIGWLPMESNPDDVVERGPYPTRFFMGLPWYHVEMGKGIRFETTNYRDQGVRLGDLALNHIRFRILGELAAL
jgi:Transglutaminase-like superfamily